MIRGPTLLARLARINSACSRHALKFATVNDSIGPLLAQYRTMKMLSQVIKEDHEEMYEHYIAFKKARASGDLETAAKFSNQLRWDVARHSVGEELIVYPIMEQKMGTTGKKLADQDRDEALAVKEMLQPLEALDISSAEHQRKMNELMDFLKRHNEHEEKNDLAQLEPTLGHEGSIAAARSFARTKQFVPTRSHPAAPNHLPYETLAGFLVAPIDKLRDYFLSWPTSEQKEQVKKDYEAGGGRSQVGL